MAEKPAGHILIECPNTIFHLYARDEGCLLYTSDAADE